MENRVGERGKPYLTPILHLIYFDHPSFLFNLEITFSYNLIATALSSKGTFSSSNLFHRLFLGTVLKAFLKPTKLKKGLDLSIWHSSTMILNVMRWSVVECYLLKSTWLLACLPSLLGQMLNFFSKIIPYNLAKRGLIIIVRSDGIDKLVLVHGIVANLIYILTSVICSVVVVGHLILYG